MTEPTISPFEEFQRALVASAENLFTTLGQPVSSWAIWDQPTPVTDDTVVASLGFGGDHFRGNIILATTLATATPLCPPITGELDPSTLCDMFGEVGNMLLGRLKNEILQLGVTLHIGLPTTALATPGRSPRQKRGVTWHVFHLPSGPCFIRLAATFESAFVLAREPALSPIGVEGDLFFF